MTITGPQDNRNAPTRFGRRFAFGLGGLLIRHQYYSARAECQARRRSRIPIWRFTTKNTRNTKPGEQRVGDDMPIEDRVTQPVTDMRGETSLQEPIESDWNLVRLVSLVFLLRIPGRCNHR
jgi:hypothetical protein